MCHDDTCVPHGIRDEQILIGGYRWCKKNCPLIRGVHFFRKLVNISLIFKNLLLFLYLFEVAKVSGRHRGHFRQRE